MKKPTAQRQNTRDSYNYHGETCRDLDQKIVIVRYHKTKKPAEIGGFWS